MTSPRDTLQRAITALMEVDRACDRSLIEELESLAAAPAQEPRAWSTFDGEGGCDFRAYEGNETYREEYIARNGEKYAGWVEPLYTTPPDHAALLAEARDALSDCERDGCGLWASLIYKIDAALKGTT